MRANGRILRFKNVDAVNVNIVSIDGRKGFLEI